MSPHPESGPRPKALPFDAEARARLCDIARNILAWPGHIQAEQASHILRSEATVVALEAELARRSTVGGTALEQRIAEIEQYVAEDVEWCAIAKSSLSPATSHLRFLLDQLRRSPPGEERPATFVQGEWQRCPTCDALGVVQFNPLLPTSTIDASTGPYTCPTCKGLRLIERPCSAPAVPSEDPTNG